MREFCIVSILWLHCICAGAQPNNSFEQTVARLGLSQGVTDESQKDEIAWMEPRLAYVNLTGFDLMPVTKSMERRGWIEVYDGRGHYFKKPVKVHAQGNYSLKFPKKSLTFHLCDEKWDEENGAECQIGNWVKQHSFHLKAFYTDFMRGIGEVGYRLYEDMVTDRAPFWERGGMPDKSKARCFPGGFPCVVYLNGDFYGIYAWQLKKSRKNMNMKKDVAKHIHLDGSLQDKNIFRGSIIWSSFEVRNPEGLYDKNGNVYNGNSPKELMDEASRYYADETDMPDVTEGKRRSCMVKKHIVQMSHYWDELHELEHQGANKKQMRVEIEKRYEIQSLIDYAVFHYFTSNGDGSLKNWQWFTYDGTKWMVTPYDLDQTFGINLFGVVRPAFLRMDLLESGPFYWITRYYQEDIQERYAELREMKVLDYDHILPMFDDWYRRVGEDFYNLEKEKWPNSPCFRKVECCEGWDVCNDWSLYSGTSDFEVTHTYHAGDIVKLEGRLWIATETTRGRKPYVINANIDSLARVHQWVADRIDFLDILYNYTREPNAIADISNPSAISRLVGIYTLSGIKVNAPEKNKIYIFKYSDGKARKVLCQ